MRNKISLLLLGFILMTFMGPRGGQSQPAPEELPDIKLREITFRVREIQSSPSPLKILEIYVEVLNKSRRMAAPPNSVKAVLSQKEVVFEDPKPADEFTLTPQEANLSVPLPPLTGRVLVFGITLPKEKIESITFEIQVNPPDGDRKTVKWEER
ncbi:MAG: hypothetical protein FJ115_12490 [Deltaproteobacteria bacterium]|nr:hypothetical protein [Deltaproteobacteria bacterium]